MESQKYSLNGYDLKRLAIHLLWYGLGFGLIAVLKELKTVDFGQFTDIAGLVIGFVVDSISRYIEGK